MESSRKVVLNRTQTRRLSLSNWTKRLGYECPRVDLDEIVTTTGHVEGTTIMLEYDCGKPTAIIDYKQAMEHWDCNKTTISSQAQLATMAGLPFFVVVYKVQEETDTRVSMSWFHVYPLNDIARGIVAKHRRFSEREFAQFHCCIRKSKSDPKILKQFNKHIED